MPPIDYAEYLFEFANEIGMYSKTGFGLDHVSWSEINSWQQLTGIKLSIWEANTIMMISKSFVSQYNDVNEKIAPSPYQSPVIDRAAVSQNVGSVFRSIASRKKSGFKGPKTN